MSPLQHKLLFLDDVRTGPMDWTVVRSADEFINAVNHTLWTLVSLDYNLGHYTKDGIYVAEWLVRNMNRMPPRILIHTSNFAAAEEMIDILQPHTTVHRVDYNQLLNWKYKQDEYK